MKSFFSTSIVILILIFASCSDDSEMTDDNYSSPTEAVANVEVVLVDAPATYDAVLVEVLSVEYRLDTTATETEDDDSENDDDADDDDSDEDEEDGEWASFDIEPSIFDLLALNNGESALLADTALSVGTLTGIRLILGDGNQIVVDGDTLGLFVPSGAQSGLKINLNAEIEEGISYKLVLDFDAGMSVVERGNGSFLLKPVVRADLQEEAEEFGSIYGVVAPDSVSSTVYAIDAENDSASTQPESDGTFLFEGLESGVFTVSAVPDPETDFSTVTIEDIQVNEGSRVELDTLQFEQ